jgi:hypothetical protein
MPVPNALETLPWQKTVPPGRERGPGATGNIQSPLAIKSVGQTLPKPLVRRSDSADFDNIGSNAKNHAFVTRWNSTTQVPSTFRVQPR